MEIEMKYIYEIFKQRSFSKAAEILYVTQPTLSLAVKRVESELGMPIFERKKNPITLTPAGEIYINKIKLIKRIEQDLEDEINDLRDLKLGKLRIGGTNYINSYVLPPIISKFLLSYPNIELSIIEASSDRLIQMVGENEIDLTFNCGFEDEKKFIYFDAFIDEIYLAIPNNFLSESIKYKTAFEEKGWKLSKSNPIAIDDIGCFEDIPFIFLKQKNNLFLRSTEIIKESGYTPNVIQYVEQLATAYRFCLDGIGATFIGSKLLESEKKIDDRITLFSFNTNTAVREFSAVINKDRYLSNSLKQFMAFTQNYYL